MSPFVVLALGVAFVIAAIAVFKMHPFLALIIAAVLVGVLSPQPLEPLGNDQKRPSSIELGGATVSIVRDSDPETDDFDPLRDELVFASRFGITGKYDKNTGVLELSGKSSLSNYQMALRSILYRRAQAAPTSAEGGDVAQDASKSDKKVTRLVDFEIDGSLAQCFPRTAKIQVGQVGAAERLVDSSLRIADLHGSRWGQVRRSFEHAAFNLGKLVGSIGIVIAIAAVIGQCLMESGAADKIVRRLLGVIGEKRANYALLGSGYVLSIPVFFDTVFFLLVPLARAMKLRTGKNYVGYVLAICAGGAVTHSLVPPTPGPLYMAAVLDIDLGQAIVGGFLLGLPVAFFGGIVLPRLLGKFLDIPMRETPGTSMQELEEIVQRDEKDLPGFLVSIAPVALPVLMIMTFSITKAILGESPDPSLMWIWDLTAFFGDKNFAMILAGLIAMWVLKKQKGYSFTELTKAIEPALMAAGVIILITAAGGSFGGMIRNTGIADAIAKWDALKPGTDSTNVGMMLLLVAFGVASIMKVAQGSGTVAMTTTAPIMVVLIAAVEGAGGTLPYHPIYIFAAIAYGSKVISWMNDSGFWVVSRMSGFNQSEALKTWTLQLGSMGVIGLIEILILSRLLPLA